VNHSIITIHQTAELEF